MPTWYQAGQRRISPSDSATRARETACLIDFDHDGLYDLFLGDTLYRNRGNRSPRFQKVSTLQKASACAVGDFNNDDYADLFIATADSGVLYRNDKGRMIQADIGSMSGGAAAAFIDL